MIWRCRLPVPGLCVFYLTSFAMAAVPPHEAATTLREMVQVRESWSERAKQWLRSDDDLSVAMGAYVAGEFRLDSLIPVLIQKIMFSPPSFPSTALWPWTKQPCQQALVKIGKPASKPVMEALAKEKDAKRCGLLVFTLAGIEGDDVAEFLLQREIEWMNEKDIDATGLKAALKHLRP